MKNKINALLEECSVEELDYIIKQAQNVKKFISSCPFNNRQAKTISWETGKEIGVNNG